MFDKTIKTYDLTHQNITFTRECEFRVNWCDRFINRCPYFPIQIVFNTIIIFVTCFWRIIKRICRLTLKITAECTVYSNRITCLNGKLEIYCDDKTKIFCLDCVISEDRFSEQLNCALAPPLSIYSVRLTRKLRWISMLIIFLCIKNRFSRTT